MEVKPMLDDLLGIGLTQVEIAQAVGCKQSYISKLHRGEHKRPSLVLGLALIALHKRHERRIEGSLRYDRKSRRKRKEL